MNPSPADLRTHRRRWSDLTVRFATFAKRLAGDPRDGDPYYNPNLTLRKSNFALRDLKKEKIGEPYKLEVPLDE